MVKQQLILIGNGMAGGRVLSELLRYGPHRYQITVIGAEPGGCYNRIMLSPWLAGEATTDEIITHPLNWYQQHNIRLISNDPVVDLDLSTKHLVTASGFKLSYHKLIFATGSNALNPAACDASTLKGLISFRSLIDAEAIKQSAAKAEHALVIGGGLLGLEAAYGLRKLGIKVTLIHRAGWLMNRQLDAEAAELLANEMNSRGIEIKLNCEAIQFNGDSSNQVSQALLSDGTLLETQLVVSAIGITPNISLATHCGLTTQRGITVDSQMRTSNKDIYALGECCEFEGNTFGLVAPIWEQAKVLADQLCGEQKLHFASSAVATKLKVSGIDLFSAGEHLDQAGLETQIYRNSLNNHYRKLLFRDQQLVGVVLYGDVSDGQWYFNLITEQTSVAQLRPHLMFGEDYSEQTLAATHLPTLAQTDATALNRSSDMKKTKLIVIGNGMVGHHFLESLYESGQSAEYQVTVIGEERHIAYDRVHLSEYFTGSSAEDLSLTTSSQYQEWGYELILGDKVSQLDRTTCTLTTDSGKTLSYDKVILATGSYPFVPPVPGHDRDNCFVYRTLDDLDAIRNAAANAKTGVVVGGGLLGLEAAKALRDLGLETHVVEFAPRLMAVQLDDEGGALLRSKIESLGVKVHTQKNTQLINDGETAFHRMNFADGNHLETDLILFSAGIRPQDALAKSSELKMGERGGIEVNNYCQTSDENIYAIGECALWNNQIFGLVAPGYSMAKVAVSHLTGGDMDFTGADMSTKLKLLGVDVGSVGDAHARTPGAINYRYLDEAEQVYRRIVISEDKKTLLGAILVGDNSLYDTLLQYALNGIPLPAKPESLILPAGDGSSPALGADALPDSASICSCLNVTKGQICSAVQEGATDVASVKALTKASTGCGGCAALLKDVINAELSKLGIEVNTSLCEHFAHTREELYHIVRVGEIKTFKELISKHGQGHGCEICKPTAASIFASCWNEHIHETPLVSLQDTNDTFMANMQRNGTYSVVPRVPGGEITPEKLIVLGEVAKKYNLYTKITGGQRIDLFGAQLHELPLIWGELIDAGFETGHAYGKSLRTVKSCVGSTWCRFGVQDSVGMAIDLENRYKGLRAPHKIKFAVSGCTRECAEAQSKDIGVIATENGWNLYVCGNGGMKPRHADLFATDLDDETLVRYIDRVLMFYVKTADRLQRTSVWMDNLEGGLDYLREVVINDSLGVAEELESQMEAVVDTYQCEWKTAIEDPEKLKRFRTFVNSDGSDTQILMIEERGQIRPA